MPFICILLPKWILGVEVAVAIVVIEEVTTAAVLVELIVLTGVLEVVVEVVNLAVVVVTEVIFINYFCYLFR